MNYECITTRVEAEKVLDRLAAVAALILDVVDGDASESSEEAELGLA